MRKQNTLCAHVCIELELEKELSLVFLLLVHANLRIVCVSGCATGHTLLLPALVEERELLILMQRTTDTMFKFVIVQTDATAGLQYHDSKAAPPKIQFRTCLVLDNIPKKFALDDVFWMAVYNLSLNAHPNDTAKFYGVLIPFLTGKPLESSLVEARDGSALRDPQRSVTAYVQCIFEAVNFMLTERGVPAVECDQVKLAVSAQFVHMIQNDLKFVLPDSNGQRICKLALSHLSYEFVQLTEKQVSLGIESTEAYTDLMEHVHKLTGEVKEALAACNDDDVELPSQLNLSGEDEVGEAARMQFQDMLAWEV